MSDPLENRTYPSLASYLNKAIFAIGGREWHENQNTSSILKTVDVYDVEKDSWLIGPNL